jgi:ABC-type transport system involved in cytochrome c biogenesis permease subunit
VLFAPHVAVYMLSYVFMAKAAFQAGSQLAGTKPADKTLLEPEQGTYELIAIGFPLLTLGLILGSVWGKLAWGDYWAWDPKELWSLVSWLVYVAYFHWRYMFGKRHPRINSVWALLGMAAIVITLLWVNLSKLFPGMHSYAS